MSNFTYSHNVCYAIFILESFNSHISVVICSFFEFGTVWKWCVREWVKPPFYSAWINYVFLGKTRIEQFPLDLEVIAGYDAKFTCSGSTDFDEARNMRVYWLKDEKEISTAEQRMTQNFQDNSLTISGTIVRDSGVYTCVITNGLDEDRAYAILTVKSKKICILIFNRHGGLVVRVSAWWGGGCGFDPRPQQIEVFKTGSSGFLHWR